MGRPRCVLGVLVWRLDSHFRSVFSLLEPGAALFFWAVVVPWLPLVLLFLIGIKRLDRLEMWLSAVLRLDQFKNLFSTRLRGVDDERLAEHEETFRVTCDRDERLQRRWETLHPEEAVAN